MAKQRRIRLRGRRGRPWYRASTDCYYVKEGGRTYRVVDAAGQPLRGPDREPEAAGLWVQMQLADQRKREGRATVLEVLDAYLTDAGKDPERGLASYRAAFRSLLATLPEDMPAADLRVDHVEAWHAAAGDLAESTRGIYERYLLAALNWAAKPERGMIVRNPLRGMRRHRIVSRGAESLVSQEGYERFVALLVGPIRDVVVTLRETGTRPINVCR